MTRLHEFTYKSLAVPGAAAPAAAQASTCPYRGKP